MAKRRTCRRHRLALFVIAPWIALSAFINGCGLEPPRMPLRIATSQWPTYELLHLAERLGYFREEGVRVRLVEYMSLADSRRAFARGQVDGLVTTPIDLAVLEQESPRQLNVVQVLGYSHGGDVLLALAPITDMPSLRGKRVAIEQGLGTYFLARALALRGMSLRDVEVVYLSYTLSDESFRAGKVDAVHSCPPMTQRLLAWGGDRVCSIFSSHEMPGEILDVLAVDKRIHFERCNEVDAIVRAIQRASAYAVDHPSDASEFMAAREGISSAQFAAILEHDLKLVADEEQAEYLSPSGRVKQVQMAAREILRVERNSLSHSDVDATGSPRP